MAGLKALKDRLKGSFCGRSLAQGDLVRVPGGTWAEYEHEIGGRGRWAIVVGKKGTLAIVRPLLPGGVPGDPVTVEKVEHIDDAIAATAIKEFYAKRSRASNGAR